MPGKHAIDAPAGLRISATLADHGPASVERLSRLTGYHHRTVRDQILAMHRAGRVHVAEYRHEYAESPAPAKLWAAGPGHDAEPARRPPRPARDANWATSDAAARILERLTCSPCTIKTLCADCAVSDSGARPLLRQMARAGAIHLSAYLPTTGIGGMHTKLYSLGPGRAAKRPAPRGKKVLYQEWRARKIAKYGPDIAGTMLRSRNNGGAERIVIDGRTVYQRRPAA